MKLFFSCARHSPEAASKGFLKTPQGTGYAFTGLSVFDEKLLGAGVDFGVAKSDHALKGMLKSDGTVDQLASMYST